MSAPSPVELDEPVSDELTAFDTPWVTIVWNDPVNLMSYVTFVFQNYFGYAKKKAEKLMLEVHNDGKSVVGERLPRGDGARRAGDARVRPVGHHGEGSDPPPSTGPGGLARRDHWEADVMTEGFQRRRKGGVVATFTGFEADLLRSLASQLVELLRNETAAPREGDDPLEQLLDFSGPTTEPEDPVLARLFPTAYPARRGRGRRVPALHRGHAARQQGAAAVGSSRPSRRPGCPPSWGRSRSVDIELEPGEAVGLAEVVHRHPAGAGHAARHRGRRRGLLARAARRGPAGARLRHLPVARLPPGDARRGRLPLTCGLRMRTHPAPAGPTGRPLRSKTC